MGNARVTQICSGIYVFLCIYNLLSLIFILLMQTFSITYTNMLVSKSRDIIFALGKATNDYILTSRWCSTINAGQRNSNFRWNIVNNHNVTPNTDITEQCPSFFINIYIKQGADILTRCIVFRGPASDVCIKNPQFRTLTNVIEGPFCV